MNKDNGRFYVFQKKEEPKQNKGKLILFSAITLVWMLGVVFLFLRKTDIGIILWGASFLSAFVVYLIQRNRETLDEVRNAEILADAKDINDGEGENDASKGDNDNA